MSHLHNLDGWTMRHGTKWSHYHSQIQWVTTVCRVENKITHNYRDKNKNKLDAKNMFY